MKIGVIGAGAWGTALANSAAWAGNDVTLWCFEKNVSQYINDTRENKTYLPGVKIHQNAVSTSVSTDLQKMDLYLLTVPSQFVRQTLESLKAHLNTESPLIICSKGIENNTLMLMHEVVAESIENPLSVMSGPSFAIEVAQGQPTKLNIASDETKNNDLAIKALSNKKLVITSAPDMAAIEVAGAIKNVIAIGCGISQGLSYGKNMHASLVTQGYKEMTILSDTLGGNTSALHDVSGLGDLILTSYSDTSRNMSLGLALGQGKTMSEALEGRNSVAEGIATAKSINALCEKHQTTLPLCGYVYQALYNDLSVADLKSKLLETIS